MPKGFLVVQTVNFVSKPTIKHRKKHAKACFFQLYSPAASYIASQLYSAYAERYCASRSYKANRISLCGNAAKYHVCPAGKHITSRRRRDISLLQFHSLITKQKTPNGVFCFNKTYCVGRTWTGVKKTLRRSVFSGVFRYSERRQAKISESIISITVKQQISNVILPNLF